MALLSPKARRIAACFLLIVMLTNTFFPTISYALTSGPTSPEATSFEPVDATDMVNLQTGDLTYNIPLINIPGPEGGYPLSLSYHAGIQPNEDASWVGLGWTLNPGAINRSVSGYPDDWYTPTATSRQFWEGGQTETYSVGASIGIAGTPASVNFGLSFSQDTYRGFGVGLSQGYGFGPLSVSNNSSTDGDSYMSAGIGFSDKYGIARAGASFTTDFESSQLGFSASLLGVSIATSKSGNTYGLSYGGMSASVSSSKEAGIQTKTRSYGLTIPVTPLLGISLSYSKTRYWMDENTNVSTHGSLYSSGWSVTDNQAYDSYSLLEDPSYKSIVDEPDPTRVQGGAFLDFDVYNVNAQGLGGNIRPYLLQGEVMSQNRRDQNNNPINVYYSPGVTNATPAFRFVGDFSNSYRQNYPAYPDPSLNLRAVQPPFDGSPVYGNNDGTYGYSGGNNLAGSKHIDVGVKVQPINTKGYVKSDRYLSHMIDGFSITNESGVTYHYGLPAYTWGEESYQEKISRAQGLSFNRQKKTTAYAYTWHLTAITGPDYVDRGASGLSNDDWGYWISFEYGKWSNNYNWRNPAQGYHRDEDNEFQNVSMGKKEVYYLNAIRTRSHIALFEKDIRNDGKGASPEIFNKNTNNSDYSNSGIYNSNSSQSLKLSKIYLLNSSDADAVATYSGSASAYSPGYRSIACTDCELGNNVLDKTDVDIVGRSTVELKSIRVIDFNYDYSLCPGTTNSYDINSSFKSGKLALKTLVTRGKGGVNLLPATTFDYDLAQSERKQATGTLSATSFLTNNPVFEVGDLISTNDNAKTYCGVITKAAASGGYTTYTLANSAFTASGVPISVVTTKNPAYNKDAYDMWGMYKSDANSSLISQNENVGRQTTPLSARSVDAWSLRKITSYLGTEIGMKYESDIVSKSELNTGYSYVMKDIISEAANTLKFKIETNGYPLSTIVKTSDKGKVLLQVNYEYSGSGNLIGTEREISASFEVTSIDASGTINASLTTPIPQFISSVGGGFYFDDVATGNMSVPKTSGLFGGGLRVSKISTANDNSITSSVYSYASPSGAESGITTYLPGVFDNYDRSIASLHYKRALYKDINKLLAITRELPPPGVMYEYVSVTNEVKNTDEATTREIEGKTQYQFEVFRQNMVDRVDVGGTSSRTDHTNNWGRFTTHNLAIKKFTSSIGNIKRIVQYDNNGKKLTETINHYLHDGLENLVVDQFMDQYKTRLSQYNYQGYLQERTSEVKGLNEDNTWNSSSRVMATLSAKEEYPCISTGQTVINYVNGTRTKSETIGYDFYSGAVTKTVETDAYGNRFMTEVIPAYRKYSSMGLKVGNNGNKNMLTQSAGSLMYKVDASNNKLGLVSATASTWSNQVSVLDSDGNETQDGQWNIWRPQSTYSWLPDGKTVDGLTAIGTFSSFDYGSPSSSNANWKKTSEITLYDVYSKSLEAKDVNSNYATTRMGYNNSKVVVSGGPAKYYEIAYSGVEDEGVTKTTSAFIKKADGTVTSDAFHSGDKSLKLGGSGQKGLVYSVSTDKLVAGRNYIAAVWAKPVSGGSDVKLYYEVDGVLKGSSISSGSSNKTSNGWSLINLSINGSDIVPGKTFTVGCRNDAGAEAYIDDMRFQPSNASTTAYAYDKFSGELTYLLDNNNLYSRYEYDAAGRLLRTYTEKLGVGEFKTREFQYNMGQALYTPPVQQTVYARMEVGNSQYFSNSNWNYDEWYTTNDVYIRFYSDPDCTVPLILTTNINFQYTRYYSWSDSWGSGGSNYLNSVTGLTGASEIYIGNFTTEYFYNYYDSYYGWQSSSYYNSFDLNNIGSSYNPTSTYYY